MIVNDRFQFDDPMGMLETAKTSYEPGGNEINTVREMIKEEEFLNHCKQLNGQRMFMKNKLRLSERRILDELWKKLTYK